MMRKVFALLLSLMIFAIAGSALAAGPEDTWKITSPADGANVTGPDVTITIDPGQIKVAKPGPVVAGEGHWHFFVDGKEVGRGPVNTFTFKGLTPGKHTLKVELHQGDHTPYPNDKGREITVNVSLPNTGASTVAYAAAGLLLLAAGGSLFILKGALQSN